mmetsp:Transcript_901/g.2083  ORF Transcript_901/g.2083 Transcript_901/m.2083 type:complete len:251 (+) Transcript_901:390-1142(+)
MCQRSSSKHQGENNSSRKFTRTGQRNGHQFGNSDLCRCRSTRKWQIGIHSSGACQQIRQTVFGGTERRSVPANDRLQTAFSPKEGLWIVDAQKSHQETNHSLDQNGSFPFVGDGVTLGTHVPRNLFDNSHQLVKDGSQETSPGTTGNGRGNSCTSSQSTDAFIGKVSTYQSRWIQDCSNGDECRNAGHDGRGESPLSGSLVHARMRTRQFQSKNGSGQGNSHKGRECSGSTGICQRFLWLFLIAIKISST